MPHFTSIQGTRLHINLFKGACLLMAACLLTACPASKQQETTTGKKVVIRGSNTIGEELAPALIAEFRKAHPEIEFDTEFKGTPYGLGTLMAGRSDIAAASRAVTTNEVVLASDRGLTLNNYELGFYSVAVVVHERNPVTTLTKDQVRDIFSGAIKNWSEVGGPDRPIQVRIRDQISGTHLGFQEVAMDGKPYVVPVKTFDDYASVAQAVAQEPDAIGYATIQLSKTPGLKAVTIGDAAPTPESVREGKYPYARLLHLYTAKPAEAEAARQFAEFAQSKAGQEILNRHGFVPRQ